MGNVFFNDTAAPHNSWCIYRIAAYRGEDTLFAWKPCSTYTYRFVQGKKEVVRFTKLSDFPIANYSGIAGQKGDSIILKETTSPKGKNTVINVKDPENPKFDGYIDSIEAMSFPLEALIPVYLKYQINSNGIPNGEYLSPQALILKDKLLIINV